MGREASRVEQSQGEGAHTIRRGQMLEMLRDRDGGLMDQWQTGRAQALSGLGLKDAVKCWDIPTGYGSFWRRVVCCQHCSRPPSFHIVLTSCGYRAPRRGPRHSNRLGSLHTGRHSCELRPHVGTCRFRPPQPTGLA